MNPYQAARLKESVFACHCPCGGELWVPGASWEPGNRVASRCRLCSRDWVVGLHITAEVQALDANWPSAAKVNGGKA